MNLHAHLLEEDASVLEGMYLFWLSQLRSDPLSFGVVEDVHLLASVVSYTSELFEELIL